ncbi:MAG: hypothetical protein II673_02645, partial [Ruminococcus sp.]|nr:hypothetical protein [Ruminococcus sp.]
MLYRHRRQRRKMRKGVLILLSIAVTFGFLVYGFEKQVAVFSESYIPSFAHRAAAEAINDAVTAKINELDYSYEDIVKITYMKSGEVSAIETDSQKINLLKAQTTRAAQDELTAIKHSHLCARHTFEKAGLKQGDLVIFQINGASKKAFM